MTSVTHALVADGTPKVGAADWNDEHVVTGVGGATISETDPGAIGVGNTWVRLDPSQSYPPTILVRNQTDDEWVDWNGSGYSLGLTYYDGVDVGAWIGGSSVGVRIEEATTGNAVRVDATRVRIVGPLVLGFGPSILQGSDDPSAGAGIAANLGSIYIKVDTGAVFWKSNTADTAWTSLPFGALTNYASGEPIAVSAVGDLSLSASGGDMSLNGDVSLTLNGNAILIGTLPTSDPANVGQLWNNAGVLMVSSG